MYINMNNKVGDKEQMGPETHLMCFVGGQTQEGSGVYK